MKTAEALEAMSNTGEFEILSARVLRNLWPDCRALTHLGVNDVGKTVRGPVDAFCRVPNSLPALYVMAAFTTSQTARLEGKWLSDADGDIAKAASQAKLILLHDPEARFALYLCTNRIPSENLQISAIERGRDSSIEVRFLGTVKK